MKGGDPDTWLNFWRLKLGLDLREYLLMTRGEVEDLIACYQIAHGIAEYVPTVKNKNKSNREYIPELR